jgi:CRP-like cAMP-binding protein
VPGRGIFPAAVEKRSRVIDGAEQHGMVGSKGDTGLARLGRDARRAALMASPLFAAMTPEELETVLTMAVEHRYRRGQTIFQKDDAGTAMMAVLTGRVRISTISADGKEVTLNVISPGEVFGEIALLDGKPRSADATAIEESCILVLERRDFLPFVLNNQDLTARLLAILCERLRKTSVALEDIALFDLPIRLARVLLKLGDDYGRPTEAGLRIDLKLSQKDLSNLVAATRESINKQLRIWREAGLVILDGGYLVLPRPARLQRMVDGDAP